MFTKVHLRILYVFSFLTACFVQVSAHEFWIEPTKYQLNDNIINAHLRVGQEFQGMALMYNPQDFTTFKILSGSKNKKEKVKGILGDVPALNTKTKLEDLLIIYHETTDKFVNYKKFQKFKDFVSEKGYEGSRHWLMFLFDCKKTISQLPENFEEGSFAFFGRDEIKLLSIPESDHELIWPFYDKRDDGVWGLRADWLDGKPNIMIESKSK